jgi:hypothetical protein
MRFDTGDEQRKSYFANQSGGRLDTRVKTTATLVKTLP